ncbi:hypothetical protein IQ266_06505, partial [filamentous cyanobacterium LEGE 11480]
MQRPPRRPGQPPRGPAPRKPNPQTQNRRSRPNRKTAPSQGRKRFTQRTQAAPGSRSARRAPKKSFRFPWQKKRNTWFKTEHPAQRRNLPKSNWFPYAPEEPDPKTKTKREKKPFKFELRYRPWMSSISSVLLVIGVGSLVSGIGWLSMQYLMHPKSIVWVNSYLPKPLQIKIAGWDQPYTLIEVQRQLKASGLTMGAKIRLTNGKQADMLIPVLKTDNTCISSLNTCTKIVELRVYRPTQHPYKKAKSPHFQMIDQLPISGMEDWFVQEPFVNAQVDVPPPSDRLLGFDRVEKLERRAPKGGTWLTLKGEQTQLGLYGQIFLYSPKTASLVAMVPWSSPNGELPNWENIASGGTSELVVDQTIGLETLYQVYSLQPDSRNVSGLALKPIDLKQPALNDRQYADAIDLARNGLWSLALKRLQSFGKQTFTKNPVAGLQRDVIAYHAKRFQTQADRDSASTSQQVQAHLLDGRWEKAIAVVKSVPGDREDVIELLNADAGQLIRRLKAATTITPGNRALQAWNAAMKLARSGQSNAIAWL